MTSPGGEFVSLVSAATPATTLWRADGNGAFETNWVSGNPVVSGSPRTLNAYEERHLDTVNVLYLDGHVKSMKMDALTKVGTSGGYAAFTMEDD
ncbi:hypothetical protein IAD21_00432 [Abditibacteriota bacterium]|nr:hypothetical protein IAD21_00432 [Abditibacteriota bacterium]